MLLKPNVGRALSAIGALVLIVALFLVWYHIERPSVTDSSTGWETFPRLRIVILVGALLTIGTALVRQVRAVLVVRTLLGLVLAILILRRIVFAPTLADPVSAQIGVYVGFVAAVLVALGGLVDTGRRVVETYPSLWRPPVAELGRGTRQLDQSDERP